MEQMLHGKSKGGKIYAASFQELWGKISSLIVALLSPAN